MNDINWRNPDEDLLWQTTDSQILIETSNGIDTYFTLDWSSHLEEYRGDIVSRALGRQIILRYAFLV